MINSNMKLSEIDNTTIIKLKDSKRFKYKTLKEISLKNALQEYVIKGGSKPKDNEYIKLPEQDWDNPTNDELERELQQANDIMIQRKMGQQQKKYDFEKTKKRFYAKHGPEKAERMLHAMREKGAFE